MLVGVQLTGSGTALGLVTALQTIPVLLFGPWGGVVADRFPKRRILYVTQTVSAVLGLLGTLVATGAVRIEMVYLIALCLGAVSAVDNPTRQASWWRWLKQRRNSQCDLTQLDRNQSGARVIGPAIAGILIASVGLAVCFLINGLSFLAVLAVLMAMRAEDLRPTPIGPRMPGQLRQGLRYVRASPVIRTILVMMAIIGTFTYEFSVSLPLFAEVTFGAGARHVRGDDGSHGPGRGRRRGLDGESGHRVAPASHRAALLFGATVLLTAVAPSLPLALLALVAWGSARSGLPR